MSDQGHRGAVVTMMIFVIDWQQGGNMNKSWYELQISCGGTNRVVIPGGTCYVDPSVSRDKNVATGGTLSVRDHTVYRSGFQPGHVPCIVVELSVLRTRAGNYQTMSTDREFNQSRCLVLPHRNVAHLASNRIVCLACSIIANFAM